MTYTSAYGLGPGTTPYVIKWLILLTTVSSILIALVNPLFVEYLNIQGPNQLFSLSWYGLKSGYLWQPITYLFIEDGISGLSFGLLITLFFEMYILWIMGSSLAEKVSGYSFLIFYLMAGIVTGLVTVLSAQVIGHSPFLMGPWASIISLWVAWTMMHPESELLFFFLIPLKAKWLLAGALSALLLVNLSQGVLAYFIFTLTGALFGYLYAVLAWDLEGPFTWTRSVDLTLGAIRSKLVKNHKTETLANPSKIIDIHTGSPFLDDEAFVDAMLTKISQKGEHTLTWSERRRLRKISEKKHFEK